ncbi:hypothetical protein SELMODRAFT_415909 [Selaginella moellendorffii]|uniref:Uncharacterized protein n=1 Tax=Selaginella moellendorffii TaxID=88036 RepID=D8RYK4_SELML|nr:hypothetical protein SELMODRAFT_415909 [Selaginella moellendorffii]
MEAWLLPSSPLLLAFYTWFIMALERSDTMLKRDAGRQTDMEKDWALAEDLKMLNIHGFKHCHGVYPATLHVESGWTERSLTGLQMPVRGNLWELISRNGVKNIIYHSSHIMVDVLHAIAMDGFSALQRLSPLRLAVPRVTIYEWLIYSEEPDGIVKHT